MKFTWNDAKNATNKRKHGISFQEAMVLFTSGVDYLEISDEDHSVDEDRFLAIGPIVRGLVWTERDEDTIRIIGARWDCSWPTRGWIRRSPVLLSIALCRNRSDHPVAKVKAGLRGSTANPLGRLQTPHIDTPVDRHVPSANNLVNANQSLEPPKVCGVPGGKSTNTMGSHGCDDVAVVDLFAVNSVAPN